MPFFTGWPGGPDTAFTMDAIFDTTSSVVQLIAHAAPNAGLIGNIVQSVPFLGQIDATTKLQPFSNPGPPPPGAYIQPRIAGGIARGLKELA